MAYTVNWITKVVSIPTSDLTLVSGTRYSLSMADCLAEVRRLEWEFDEGLWALPILDHSDTRFDFAGVDYAPFDEFINGYTVEFTGVAERVDLLGSNNNLVDILIVNGVSVVPSNSAGLQVYSTGSGLSPTQATQLERIHDLSEADEEHSPTEITRRKKGTATVLQVKDVTGSHLTGTLNITEQ